MFVAKGRFARWFCLACFVATTTVLPPAACGADAPAIRAAIDRATAYLVERGQAEDGSFSAKAGPAITALAVTALVKTGTPADAPAVQKAIDYLLRFRQADGGIHPPDSPVANYETSIAMVALAACNKDGRYSEQIKAAEAFVKGLQWDGGEGKEESDPAYGGAGYGRKNRPDLSNTSFLIEALRSVGTGADDVAIQRALVFVSRAQTLEGPHNPLPFAAKNPDGGFYYTPAAGGESFAGTTPEGGLRSYGSMTYAGLKSMIFAGLTRDDPRVKAAVSWLAKHYTFTENPGMGDAGLYYYLQTAAKALDTLGDETFTDAAGLKHVWRNELAGTLVDRQQPDGSWVNQNPRWMEGDPNLVTSYALLALASCLPKP
ncbi:MAG: prenyltransferase/squalene oxidase repeat-containing protein [Planctomycetia bacterium]